MITWNIIPELLKFKVPNITTLPALAAEIDGFRYGPMKINGQTKKVVYGPHDRFKAFLKCDIEQALPETGVGTGTETEIESEAT